ncbi:MAG: hypothetical protein VKJ64_20950 [Leptolyngbyaceae bacterium]|nr:hypothetical protein [Leptolyngbyaceae bacterium]
MVKGFAYSQRLAQVGNKMLLRLKRPLASLVLSLGLALAGASSLQVQAADLLSPVIPAVSVASVWSPPHISSAVTGSVVPSVMSNLRDGIYLYGQSPEPDQLGSAYAIVEIVGNQAIGAFYMPQSSFDCFYGAVQPEQLALNVVSSYEQSTYQYSLPIAPTAVATLSTNSQPIQLSGYHDIGTVSSSDHRILEICRSVVQNVR